MLRVLGNLFALNGFDYVSIDDVRSELQEKMTCYQPLDYQWACPDSLQTTGNLYRIGFLPIYAVDALVRRSAPLQATGDALTAGIYINSATAKAQNLSQGQTASVKQNGFKATLPVFVSDAIPADSAFIPMATEGAATLGAGYGDVELSTG